MKARLFGVLGAITVLFLTLCAVLLTAQNVSATPNQTRVATISYASTNVTTGAYVTLVSSSPISTSQLELCDTSGKVVKVATGAAGYEKDIATFQVSGCVVVPYYVPASSRISLEAATEAATSGYGVLSFIP